MCDDREVDDFVIELIYCIERGFFVEVVWFCVYEVFFDLLFIGWSVYGFVEEYIFFVDGFYVGFVCVCCWVCVVVNLVEWYVLYIWSVGLVW